MEFLYSDKSNLSISYRYAHPEWSANRNSDVYGSDASPDGLGADFQVRISGRTSVLPLVTIKNAFDHKCLFQEIDEFRHKPNTLELITLYAAQLIRSESLVELSLRESRHLMAVYDFANQKLLMEWSHSFPIQWKTKNGWGGGRWTARIRINDVIDPETGLVFVRSQMHKAVCDISHTHSAKLYDQTTPPQQIAAALAQDFGRIKGFHSVEISIHPKKTYRFFG